MSDFKKTEPVVKIARFTALTISKLIDADTKDTAQLTWSTRGIYPRITVFTSSQTTDEKGKFDYNKMITAPFDYISLQMLFDNFKKVIEHVGEIKLEVACYNAEFKNRVKTDNIVLQAKVSVGKDKNGIIYIAAIEDEKPKIKFNLLPDYRWYKHYDANSDEITDKAVISKMYATAYLKTLDKLFTSQIANDLMTVKNAKKDEIPNALITKTDLPKSDTVVDKDFGLDDFTI